MYSYSEFMLKNALKSNFEKISIIILLKWNNIETENNKNRKIHENVK